MKTTILLTIFALSSVFALSATVTITNTGFSFTPDNISINSGDIVDFQLGSPHNAVEVSEATWLANGNSPLPGFSTPFGGGQVSGLSVGVHFYVCSPHASGGMKGRITVNTESGIGDHDIPTFKIFPNPTSGKFTMQISEKTSGQVQSAGMEQAASLEIFDMLGNRVFELNDFNLINPAEIDLSAVPAGIYFIRINDRKKTYSVTVAKK